jgi:hypothetical protein
VRLCDPVQVSTRSFGCAEIHLFTLSFHPLKVRGSKGLGPFCGERTVRLR